MVIAPSSVDTNLSQLLLEASIGKIQLPEFQRDWTWDDDRIRGILASLSQGYPMGAIMRLQYGNPDIKFRYRTLEGVGRTTGIPEFLILDGQQRLTSMYQAVYDNKPVRTVTEKKVKISRFYYLDMKKCLDENEDRVEAVLSIPEDRKLKENFDRDIVLDLSDRQKEYDQQFFPLNLVFHASELTDWCTGYVLHYAMLGDQEKRAKAMTMYNQFKSDVIDTITGYKLPVITLDKSTPREAVCKVFENVNTGGVPLTVFELVTASYATQEFNLRDDWVKCRAFIRGEGDTLNTDLLDGIDETAFLTTVTLYTSYVKKVNGVSGMVSCKKRDVLGLPYEDYELNKTAVLQGYRIAREFLLKYQYVFRQRDLPYTTQLVPLAAICAYLGKSKCNEPNTTKILTRWYWCGILGEMYGGANETKYANDVQDVMAWISDGSSTPRSVAGAYFNPTRLLTLQSRQSAAYKGIMALILQNHAKDFISGREMDFTVYKSENIDIHHIFPKDYCEKNNYPKAKWNSVVNKTPITYSTNREIGGAAPSKYLSKIEEKGKVDPMTLDEYVKTHWIDIDALRSDKFDDHIISRAITLLDNISDAMGKRVAGRDSEEVIAAFGRELR